MVDQDAAAARSEATVREIELQMAEAAAPVSSEPSAMLLLSYATLLMTAAQRQRFGRFMQIVRERAEG